jgi:hypothetical protein
MHMVVNTFKREGSTCLIARMAFPNLEQFSPKLFMLQSYVVILECDLICSRLICSLMESKSDTLFLVNPEVLVPHLPKEVVAAANLLICSEASVCHMSTPVSSCCQVENSCSRVPCYFTHQRIVLPEQIERFRLFM